MGWVSKKPTEDRDYSNYENAWDAFLLWTLRWFPDKALDLMRSKQADYKNEEFFQRLQMRVYARYKRVNLRGAVA